METVRFDTLYDRLMAGEEKLALIGLGYVGMPIAVEFAKHIKVIGFNHNEHRIQQYKSGIDPTNDRFIDDTYIALSHGRDFTACPFESGVFRGGARQKQQVSVVVGGDQ